MLRRSTLLVTSACLLACASIAAGQSTISIKGSETMWTLNRELVAAYADVVPGVEFTVEGAGSETGIRALMAGSIDIAATSRRMSSDELAQFQEKMGTAPAEFAIGVDGIGIYVHTSNPVYRLTVDQLAKILAGEIRNWREVGGLNRHIDVYSRNKDSGTRTFVRKNVLKDRDFGELSRDVVSPSVLAWAVSTNPNAIGYAGLAFSPGARILRIAKRDGEIATKPDEETVTLGQYPLSRTLYYYVHPDKASESVKAFIAWALSPEGQKVVAFAGHFPVPDPSGRIVAAGAPSEAGSPSARVHLGPENMEVHGYKVVVGVVDTKHPDQKQVTLIFGASGRAIRKIDTISMRIGDDAEVPLRLSEDNSLQFMLRADLIQKSTLTLTESGDDAAREYLIHLADFYATR